MATTPSLEALACTPDPLRLRCFNGAAVLPYGLTVPAVQAAMQEFIDFLGFINTQLHSRGTPRLESMLMQANFSSMVGEFMKSSIPKHSSGLRANRYHNGHPDLVPAGMFSGDAVQHGADGIEIKGSRYLTGWQGHNAEDTYLIVFSFDSNRPVDEGQGILPKSFRFVQVAAGQLHKSDWTFAGRSSTSRRTITATVNRGACQRMILNHIYKDV